MAFPPNVGYSDIDSITSQYHSSGHFAIDSSCSVDSDWSDEELQELEKILGDIQERSDAAETAATAAAAAAGEEGEEDPLERRARAVERWNKVRAPPACLPACLCLRHL